MNTQEMVDLCLAHSMYSWSATGSVDPLPVARAEGVYFYTTEGKRFLDFNSQLMSVNIGHSHPRVIAAMKAQLDSQLLYCFPATATEVRARLSKKLADITPGKSPPLFDVALLD